MKRPSGIFKLMSYLFTLLILCQSCNIYRSKNISLDEAVKTESKVKVKTTSDRKYVFKRIESREDLFYGITGKNSKAAKQLVNDIHPEDVLEDKVRIQLDKNSIQEINPKNKVLSVLVPIFVGVAVIYLSLVATVVAVYSG